MAENMEGKWEKRWHPLRQEWIVYSAHRNARPWQGSAPVPPKPVPEFDKTCYLCPGNPRVTGEINPVYNSVYVFDNDHPVVGMHAPPIKSENEGIVRRESAQGQAKVICYDPRHNITLAEMDLHQVTKVFEVFQMETQAYIVNKDIRHVLIFENKGEVTGVSNPHPHCQIYATDFIFRHVAQQLEVARTHRLEYGRNIYDDIIAFEKHDPERIIASNDYAIAFIPFFARYAYEVMIFPTRPHQTLADLSFEELEGLASVFQDVIRRMDTLFSMSFPYVMSVLQAPMDGTDYPEFRMHLWLQPPYRQRGLIKYLAGPEIGGGNFMADTMPEDKARELRSADILHYNRKA